jgi:hypothetical protein
MAGITVSSLLAWVRPPKKVEEQQRHPESLGQDAALLAEDKSQSGDILRDTGQGSEAERGDPDDCTEIISNCSNTQLVVAASMTTGGAEGTVLAVPSTSTSLSGGAPEPLDPGTLEAGREMVMLMESLMQASQDLSLDQAIAMAGPILQEKHNKEHNKLIKR